MPDRKVAKQVGVTVEAVASKRNSAGIEPYGGRKKRHMWTADEKRLLGAMSDAALGSMLGLTREVVKATRLRLEIPAYPRQQADAPSSSEKKAG